MPSLARLDFDRFHRQTVPSRGATAAGRVAGRDAVALPALAFRLPDGRAYTYATAAGRIEAIPGDAAPAVVELTEDAWQDFVHERQTAAGLFYGNRVRFVRGGPADLERWEPALRALFVGRPIFSAATLDLRARDGRPLDVRRSFALDAADDELRHFLHATGFLHVRGVLGPGEIDDLDRLVRTVQEQARPGDGTSWWATRNDGKRVVCRLIYLGLRAPAVAALNDDPRLRRLAALAREPLVPTLDRCDGHSVVIKHAGIAEGLSDLPWHRDCGLGGHPLTCPTVNVGIQLDAATAETGRLLFLAGSWDKSCHRGALGDPDLPIVGVDTEPGDCTVHLGDVLHAAPPPTGTGCGRRALYVTFMPPRAFDFIPAGQSYNDVIRARVGGQAT